MGIILILCLLLLTFINSFPTLWAIDSGSEVECKDIRIVKLSKNMNELSNCTRVNGSVQILSINYDSADTLNSISFPKLVEIDDFLFIYRILHVTTLEHWFPNLKSIRGRNLYSGYALVIDDLPQLTRLGFRSITHIRGGVRIQRVDELCFANTVDHKIISKAVTKPNLDQQFRLQALTGFRVTDVGHNHLIVMWDKNTTLNQTYDKMILKLVEIQDFDYKRADKRSCHSSGFTEQFACNPRDSTRKRDQTFIFNSLEGGPYENSTEFVDKILEIVINNNYSLIKTGPSLSPPIYEIMSTHSLTIHSLNNDNNSISNLNYSSTYIVMALGCNHRNSCDTLGFVKIKTTANEIADNIDENKVNYTVNDEHSITIEWEEPLRPNGPIITYSIQYHERHNKTHFKEKAIFCLNRWLYKQNGNKFTINNLQKKFEYSFQLRANTLNGSGIWTKRFVFNTHVIVDPTLIVYLTAGLTVLLVAFVLTATICYMKAPEKSDSKLDIISVNPEYERFIADPEWEVRREDIKLFQVLGEGAFGRVRYGELRRNSKITKCAVKTLNQVKANQQRDGFLKEANIMKSFTECNHIVKLIGIVSIENPVLVLMEYMVNDDLKTYLRLNRPDSDENPNPRVPTWQRIFQMAIEIADGMLYLSSRKYVHRDLAARNCMVAEDLTVKIGDFGMTRDIYDSDYYRKRDAGLIPVRWMAPESLKDGVYTSNSDVWSYGVVLWELVTLGMYPYQGYSNKAVFNNVINGARLNEPDNCPKKFWRIMSFCWRKHPKARPSFAEIIEYLVPSANQSFREVSYFFNRKPFTSKEESLKRFWHSLIPSNKLLNNEYIKANSAVEFRDQYCTMKSTVESIGEESNDELTAEQIKILNEMKDKLNQQKVEEMNNTLNVNIKDDTQESDSILIECF